MNIGKLPENVLKRSVLRQLKTKRSEVIQNGGLGVDCALLSVSGKEYLWTCMQEAAVAVSSDDCCDTVYAVTMDLLLQKCANNLAAAGASMCSVTIALLLPKDTQEPLVRQLMKEAEEKCSAGKVQIAGGQTRITNTVTVPTAVITAFGRAMEENIEPVKAAAGQDIVVSKWIGLEGSAYLAKRYRQDIMTRYPAYLVDEARTFDRYFSIVPEAAIAVKSGVSMMHDISEGGIFGALWELAERAGVGLTIDLKKIPLRQETVEVCEYLGANPYELMSGGSLLMLASDGKGLVDALEREGIPAVVIGRATDSNDRIILNEEEIRYMDRPKQDEIYRILGREETSDE